MNITVVTVIFPPDIGGPATYTAEILKRLGKTGHLVKVVTSSRVAQRSPNVYALPNNPVIYLKYVGFIFRHIMLFAAILRAAKNSDLIYSQTPTFLGLLSILAGKWLRKPVVLRFVGDKPWENAFDSGKTKKTLEDFLTSPEGGLYIRCLFRLQRFVFHRMSRIIVPSEFLKEVLTKYYRVEPAKIRVIYNSANLPNQSPSVNSQSFGKPCLITTGRLIQHKKIDGIIRAVKELVEEFPDIGLLIVGEGPERSNLEKFSREIGVEGKVKFYGRASHQETMNLLRGADIFILNSVYEGLPHTAIEAMSCRVPVVATNIKGTREVVKDGETGLLVSLDNDRELVDKLAQLLKNAELRSRLVENAYSIVEEKFTWEKNLEVLVNELEVL